MIGSTRPLQASLHWFVGVLLLLVLASAAPAGGSGASARSSSSDFFLVAVDVQGSLMLDYGKGPLVRGTYTVSWRWSSRLIADWSEGSIGTRALGTVESPGSAVWALRSEG